MKAIILAAGKGTRMQPLTLTKPKPLLRVSNTPLIRHNIEQMKDIVDEVIVVVGYKGDMIQKHLGANVGNIRVRYVEQQKQLGTGHALLQVKEFLDKERFIVMMGDDLYYRGDMRRCLKYDLAVMAKRVRNYQDFGIFISKDDKLLDLVEKPQKFISDLANAAFYVFDHEIFDLLEKIEPSSRGEIELTEGLRAFALKKDIFCVEAKVWIPVGFPWSLLEADQIIRDSDVKVGPRTTIVGKVSNSSIGEGCNISGFVKNSIIGDNVIVHKDSVVEDSVIGDDVEFRGTIKTGESLEIEVQKKTMKVENFGAVIGAGAKLLDVLVHPGSMIWPRVSCHDKEIHGNYK